MRGWRCGKGSELVNVDILEIHFAENFVFVSLSGIPVLYLRLYIKVANCQGLWLMPQKGSLDLEKASVF